VFFRAGHIMAYSTKQSPKRSIFLKAIGFNAIKSAMAAIPILILQRCHMEE
jgi:hypothetical protein